MKDKTNT